jgi:hypothetical protein
LAAGVALNAGTHVDADVLLDAIDGAHALTVTATDNITVGDAIGGTIALTAVTMSAGDVINVNGAITSTGVVTLSTTGDAATDDINLGGNVIGSAVTFNTGASGDTVITVAQNNTSGSTTYTGATTINGDITLTSASDMTFNGAVTVTQIAAGGITSTNGSLDFNGDLSGAQNINLNAITGNIALQTVGTGAAPTLLDLDSLTAELGGATITTAGTINFDDVGTTNLATNVVMTSGDNDIDLGTSFEGSHTLELIAGAGNVDLEAGNIAQMAR